MRRWAPNTTSTSTETTRGFAPCSRANGVTGWPTLLTHFTKHHDKHYSIVDCLSFVAMDAFGITEAWAVDSDFSHRFVVRPEARTE